MKTNLRKLALTVDEDGDGGFFWTILEGRDDATQFPVQVAASHDPYPTYERALLLGYEALATMVQEDPVRGPLTPADGDEDAFDATYVLTGALPGPKTTGEMVSVLLTSDVWAGGANVAQRRQEYFFQPNLAPTIADAVLQAAKGGM